MSRLSRLASAVVPVYPLVGAGGRRVMEMLRSETRVTVVSSPRHAAVLFEAGSLPPAMVEPALRVHDQTPHPRATVSCPAGSGESRLPGSVLVEPADVASAVLDTMRSLMSGERGSDPDFLPDEPPIEWKAVGSHGHGGAEMMSGESYGRRMAEMGPDRDGLMLDTVPLTVGPFHPSLPTGLTLEMVLQGDVVQEVTVGPNPFLGAELYYDSQPGGIPIAEVENVRAQTLLRTLAHALSAAGVDSVAARLRRIALNPAEHSVQELTALSKAVFRAARWTAGGVVRLEAERLEGLGLGHVARASGLREDPRSHMAQYEELGFATVVRNGGDSLDRLMQMLAEAEQSMLLARRATNQWLQGSDAIDPYGASASIASSQALVRLVEDRLPGLEWGDAVTFISSLGIDLEQAAVHAVAGERTDE